MPNSGQGCGEAGDNGALPVGRQWTTSDAPCGRIFCPQAVDHCWPQIPRLLTWPDEVSAVAPVEAVWTTPWSPGCGGGILPRSVENPRSAACIRTPGSRRRRTEAVRGGPGPAPDALRERSRGPSRRFRGPWRRLRSPLRSPLEEFGRPSRPPGNDEGRPEDCARVRPGRPSGAVLRT